MESKKWNECQISSCITFCCKNFIALSNQYPDLSRFVENVVGGGRKFKIFKMQQLHNTRMFPKVPLRLNIDNSPRSAITSTPTAVRNQRFNVWEKNGKRPNGRPNSVQAKNHCLGFKLRVFGRAARVTKRN